MASGNTGSNTVNVKNKTIIGLKLSQYNDEIKKIDS